MDQCTRSREFPGLETTILDTVYRRAKVGTVRQMGKLGRYLLSSAIYKWL